MSIAENAAMDQAEKLPDFVEELLGEAKERIQSNRRRTVSNRFFFGANPTVDGQPRLTRVAVRMQDSNAGEAHLVVGTEITIDGFLTESKLHQLTRYEQFVSNQVARIRTQQWVNEDNSDAVHDLTDQILNNFGWRLLNRPANLNEERTTRDIMVLTPTEAFDPDNPHLYGLPIDFEISGERNKDRLDRSFDGDFVAVADGLVPRIEDLVAMKIPEDASDTEKEKLKQMRLGRYEDILLALSAITGRYRDDDEQVWAKNCTSGAFRLPKDPDSLEPGAKIIDSFYQASTDENNNLIYEPVEANFEEIRLYGNTQMVDADGRTTSSALTEAIAEQKRRNEALHAAGEAGAPSGSDAEFADEDNPFVKAAQEAAAKANA